MENAAFGAALPVPEPGLAPVLDREKEPAYRMAVRPELLVVDRTPRKIAPCPRSLRYI